MGRGKRQTISRANPPADIIPLGDGGSQSRTPVAVQVALANDALASRKPVLSPLSEKGEFTRTLSIDKDALERNDGDFYNASVDEALSLHSQAAEVIKVNGGDDYLEVAIIDNDGDLIVTYMCTRA
jgi:hypothetical protein